MTGIAQLRLQMRSLEARVRALEAKRRRKAVPPPSSAVILERHALWAAYIQAEMQYGHGRCRLTKAAFGGRHGFPLSEFYRWFSGKDRRGVPASSGPDQRFRAELTAATAKLREDSHGMRSRSQIFGLRPAV
jgi:hypothetical protein